MVGLVGGAGVGVAAGVGWRGVVGFGLRLGEKGLFAVGHFGYVFGFGLFGERLRLYRCWVYGRDGGYGGGGVEFDRRAVRLGSCDNADSR